MIILDLINSIPFQIIRYDIYTLFVNLPNLKSYQVSISGSI